MPYKLGRLPRSFDHRIPHYSRLRVKFGAPEVKIPVSRAWSKGLPDNLGMMLNDQLGCCTAAAVYHRRQVQSFVTRGIMDTQSDAMVLSLYEQFGYTPSDPGTDQGVNLQDLLAYWLKNGVPLANGGREKLLAYFEVNPQNLTHVSEVINECGGILTGINLPQAVEDDNYPKIWDYAPGGAVAGGHAIYGTDYGIGRDNRFAQEGVTVNSWGMWDLITPRTWQGYVEEAYGLVTESWINATGETPLGMSAADLEAIMQPLQE